MINASLGMSGITWARSGVWCWLAVLPFLGAGLACAQGFPPEPPGRHMGRPLPMGPPLHSKKILRDAGLSEEQIKQVEALRYEADKQKLDIHHGLGKARLELRRLMDGDKPEESAVFAQLDQVGALDTQMKKNRIGLLLKVRGLMTPAQWEKLQAARPMRKEIIRRYRFRGDGPPSHPPMPPEAPMPPMPPMPPRP